MIMVMPISAVMFRFDAGQTQSAVKTAVVESSEQAMMMTGSQSRSYRNSSRMNSATSAAANTCARPDEGNLLLLVQTAKFVAHAGSSMPGCASSFLHVGDGRADATAFDARRSPRSSAADCRARSRGWPVTGTSVATRSKRKHMSVGRADRQVGQRRLAQLQRIGQAHPHAHGLRRLRQLGCHRAG